MADYSALAKQVSEQTGIPAEWIFAQWRHETGNFTNWGTQVANNFGGLKQFQDQPEWFTGDAKSPEGDNYQVFESPEAYADYFARYLTKYYAEDGVLEAKTPREYAYALKRGGYYGDDPDNYASRLESLMGESYTPETAGDMFSKGFNPETDKLRQAPEPIEIPQSQNTQVDNWTKAKDSFLDSFFDSAFGGGLRSVALNVAYSDHNRKDGSRVPLTDEDVEFVAKMFPGDYMTQKFVLMNANNPQHLAALAQTKKEDLERQQRVAQYGHGFVTTPASLVGALLSYPTVFIPVLGEGALAAKGIATLGKFAGAVPMSTWMRYGTKAAKYAEIGGTAGAFNVLDRYGSEKLAGYNNQDYTSAFVLGAALGGGLSAGIDVFRYAKDHASQRIVTSARNAQDHVAAQTVGAELPNAARNTRADIEAIHDPSFHEQVKSDSLKPLTENGKVFAVSKEDMLNLSRKWGVEFKEDAKAFYHDGYAAIVKDNIKPGDNIDSLLLHEIGVHGGMRNAVGESAWDSILNTVQQQLKNPQGAWKEAMRRTPDGGLEEILGHYVELAGTKNNKFMTSIKSTVAKTMRDMGIASNKITDSEILDFAHKALKAEVDNARGYITHPDGSVTQGGLKYSAASATNPNIIKDVAGTKDDVLLDTQGGTGIIHKVGQWFENGWFSGTLGGILQNSQIKETARFARDVFHDARMRAFKGSGPKPIELQKADFVNELNGYYHGFISARDKYIAENMAGTRFGLNADARRLEVNKQVYDYLNMQYGGHKGTSGLDFPPGIKEVAESYKALYDAMTEIGKTSAKRYGYSHPNMIDKDFVPRTGEMWRVVDPERRYNTINNLLGGYKDLQELLHDYGNMFADRKALSDELLEIRQKEWDVKKAEYDKNVQKYKEDLEKTPKPKAPKPLEPRPAEVTKEDLTTYIDQRSAEWAKGQTDKDMSRIHEFGSNDSLTFFRQRFPMDTSGVMMTKKGIPFSFDTDMRSYDLDGFTHGIINRFAGEAAFRNKFPDASKYDAWRESLERKHYGYAVDQKNALGVTEEDKRKELKALDHAVSMLRGTMSPVDGPTKANLLAATGRKIAYAENGANMGWNQIGEMGGALGYSGFRAAMHVLPALNNLVTKALKGEDHVKCLNEVTRHLFGQNIQKELWKTDWASRSWHDLVGETSKLKHMDKIDSAANYMGKVVSTFNMMPRLTDWMVTGARSEAIADSVEWAIGKQSSKIRNPFSVKKLQAAGINNAAAENIKNNLLKYTEFNSQGGMKSMDIDKWMQEDPRSLAQWRFLLDNQSMRTIQQATIGNTAYVTSAASGSTFMKMLFQFKDFSLKAINGATLRALTSREIDDAVAAVGSMATNTAVYTGLTWAKSHMYFPDDEKKRKEYMEKMLAPERLATAAFLRGVMTGSIAGFAGDAATGLVGMESFRTTFDNSKRNFQNKDRDASDVIGDTLGQFPVARVLESTYKAGKAVAEGIAPHQNLTKREVQDALKLFPLQNALPMLYLNTEISNNFLEKEKKGDYWFVPSKTTGRY